MISQAIAKVAWRRFLAQNARPWEELAEFPLLSAGVQRRLLADRLFQQMQYFGWREDALPEWREAAGIRTADELWRVWPELPIMRKADLKSRFHPDELQSRLGIKGWRKSTGGSTGEPTHFLHDEAMLRSGNAAATYAQTRLGWRPGMAVVKVWGSERDIGKETSRSNRTIHRILRQHLVDGYRLTDETVDRVLRLIARERPVCLSGFTSMLEFVARAVVESGRQPLAGAVWAAWNGGEMLFETQVELFRKAFGVPILNFYGGRELSTMAAQFADGSPLAVLRPWLFLEVVDERGKPVGPGVPGRLVWTSTICRATPFLRYDIEDLGMFERGQQTEAGIGALAELHGRTAGLLELPNGRKINALYWNHLFKDVPEVRQFQVRLCRAGNLKLLLKGDGFTAEREAELRRIVGRFLGDVPLAISWVEQIPLSPQGKLMQVVRELVSAGSAR